MARVQKFSDAAVVNQLRHNNREIQNSSNKDIDKSRSNLNYSLTPDRGGLSEYEYYRKRKAELYCYGRADVKTMAGWIVTLPKEVTEPEAQEKFFETTYDFLEERYGQKNVIQATVHYDEGKRQVKRDRFTGKAIIGPDGEAETELVVGQPHLHFCFIPVTADTNSRHFQEEKICANDVLNRRELQRFHGDLERYLADRGVQGQVRTGITKASGRNRTVAELKERTEMEQRIKELERELKRERDRNIERTTTWR